MRHDFSDYASIYSVFDDSTCTLEVSPDTVITESPIRRLGAMRELFVNAHGYDDALPLYYMYNGIYRQAHKAFFAAHNIKYEYTVLLTTRINGECIKAHGHIHGIHPIKKVRHQEAYEILYGEGYFELFKYVDSTIQVVLIKLKQGDFVTIPPDYYHLSINTGNVPFIFGDLIINDAESDYSHLKVKKGAPLYVFKDEAGTLDFQLNPNYLDHTVKITHVTAETCPWPTQLVKIPLYAHFITHPERFEFLK